MWLLKKSVYKVFCGGETEDELLATMQKLQSRGVKIVLDYAVEASPDDVTSLNANVFDNNACSIWNAVVTAAAGYDALVALKVSALGPVSTIERAGEVIAAVERLFAELCGMPAFRSHERILPDLLMRKELTKAAFVSSIQQLIAEANVPQASEEDINLVFRALLAQPGGGEDKSKVSYFQWTHLLQPHKVGRGNLSVFKQLIPPLSDADAKEVAAAEERLSKLCEMTANLGTKAGLLVDAEHSRLQGFIRNLTCNVQKRFNKDGKFLIYNTYQAYLKETKSQLRSDLEMARRFGFRIAVKLVRGAYLSFERKSAKEHGYPCPVLDSLEDTHESFDSSMHHLLDHIGRVAVFIGTHNAESVRKATALLSEFCQRSNDVARSEEASGCLSVTASFPAANKRQLLTPASLPVSFGQLLGLSDDLTFMLSSSGFKVYKYVPYGPVNVTIPYLLRRVQENSGIMGRAGAELVILYKEIKHRLRSLIRAKK
ncbi:proline dehydrogenase [Toxoplasma gondii ME49]|uniref:Proline dehydrogenase n=1 Tax=Toxoplasma gondii (strain ATCC 50611 / Me49) TaxID=508771 RepID=S8GNU8_TOXGM|nr:proline dehydrogenase [Toxoplasma gondii ME49]EPT30234.1 proline dehydrogenase [Toxoplasma gondii ME49]|eukprot:XP_002367519.1 proline dehydrogenase [Toxoplasma gondii ME49]